MTTQSPQQSQSPQQATDKIGWTDDIWKRLHEEVHHELTRARVAAKFLPTVHVHAKTLSVPADVVSVPQNTTTNFSPGSMTVDEGLTLRINEFWTEFVMTPAQVQHEAAQEAAMAQAPHGHHVSTGVTLATRAANLLAQAEDMLIMQGANALLSPYFSTSGSQTTGVPLPTQGASAYGVNYRGIPLDLGLFNLALGAAATYPQQPTSFGSPLTPIPVVPVQVNPGLPPSYQGATVAAVAQGCSALQAQGQCGPYALVLESVPWADTLSPLPSTLILPAIPIKELVTAGFHVTGGLPPWNLPVPPAQEVTGAPNGLPPAPGAPYKGSVAYTGVLLSLGGHPFDLVRCRLHENHDALVTYENTDPSGNLHFRIRQRFALRIKDITAVVPLLFMSQM